MNGIRIKVDGDDVSIIKNNRNANEKDIVKDTVFKEDFHGDIRIAGDNVTIKVEGSIHGDIVGNCNIEVKGQHIGDIVGNVHFK